MASFSASSAVTALRLYVRSLAWSTSNKSLESYFSQFGPVTDCNIAINQLTGRSRGFGFVTFENEESFKKALESTTHDIDGRMVTISPYRPRDPNPITSNTGDFQSRSPYSTYSADNSRNGFRPRYGSNSNHGGFAVDQRSQQPGEFRPQYPPRTFQSYR